MSKKWVFLPAILLALWGCYVINFNLVRHSGYYAQHLPHKKGTNPELIFTLKYLYYLEKPDNSSLRYDYDGSNSIMVNEEYFIFNYQEPKILLSRANSNSTSTSYQFDNKGQFMSKRIINRTTSKSQDSESSKSKEEAMAYVERAIRPILDVQPKPKHNLQWLFNLIHQGKFN